MPQKHKDKRQTYPAYPGQQNAGALEGKFQNAPGPKQKALPESRANRLDRFKLDALLAKEGPVGPPNPPRRQEILKSSPALRAGSTKMTKASGAAKPQSLPTIPLTKATTAANAKYWSTVAEQSMLASPGTWESHPHNLSEQERHRLASLQNHMPSCTSHYVASLVDPFNVQGACVPSVPCWPSAKRTVWAKGTMATQASHTGGGWGFIAASAHGGVSNDVAAVYHTTAASTVVTDTFSKTGSAAGGAAVAPTNVVTNSPFVAANWGPDASDNKYRLVSAGVRIRYIGKELDLGGSVAGFNLPFSLDVFTSPATTATSLLGNAGVHMDVSVSERPWYEVTWRPTQPNEFNDFHTTLGYNFDMALGLHAPDATESQTWQYEFFLNFEVIGPLVAQSMTKMKGDVTGSWAVMEWASSFYNTFREGVGTVAEVAEAIAAVSEIASVSTPIGMAPLAIHGAKLAAKLIPGVAANFNDEPKPWNHDEF